MKEQGENRDVTALTDMMSRTSPPTPVPRASQRQSDADMDTAEKDDGKTDDRSGAKKAKSSAVANSNAKTT